MLQQQSNSTAQNHQSIANSKKKKKNFYLDYSLVSPTYENHEMFKSPLVYSARNANHLRHISQHGGPSANTHLANQLYPQSQKNSVERRRNNNPLNQNQEGGEYDENKLRRALYAVNVEQGMLIDNMNLDLYKKRKKSIPTIESTSQFHVEQALQYYSAQKQREGILQNPFKQPPLRQSRIVGNAQNQLNQIQVVQPSKNSEYNCYDHGSSNYVNQSVNYSTVDSKIDESVDISKRQMVRRVVGGYSNSTKKGTSSRNASPNRLYAYDGGSQGSDQKVQHSYISGIYPTQEKKNKSISVYSAQDIGVFSYGQSSTASLALDPINQSQGSLNQIHSQKRLQKLSSKHTMALASVGASPNNTSMEKLPIIGRGVNKQLQNGLSSHNSSVANFSLNPIQQTRRQKEQNPDYLKNSSIHSNSHSPTLSPKPKLMKNNSMEMSQDNIGSSQVTLAQNGSITQLHKTERQHALCLPKIKVIVLELVNDYEDIDQKFIKIDMEKYWLSLLNKSVRMIADSELIQRMQPFINEIMQSDYYLKYRTNQLSGKYQLKEISKWNFLKEIQSYEKLEIPQNKFYEFIIYYFLPTQEYRDQLMKDLCLAINQKAQKAFPFCEDIDTLMDVNGKEINDLYEFNISQRILLAGNKESLNTLYPSFQKHLQAYNKNLERINFIKERKKNFQQAFVIQDTSQSQINTMNIVTSTESPTSTRKQLKLPQILKIPPNLTAQNSQCSLTSPQKKYPGEKQDLVLMSGQKSTQRKLENRQLSLLAIQEFKSNQSQEDHQSSQVALPSQKKIIVVKKEQKNSLYLTKGDIEACIKKYDKLVEKDILNFHAEFKQLVLLNVTYEEKANVGINTRLKKPFRDYLLYTQIFFSLNPSFADKERQFQTQILVALQIEINVGDHQHSTLCWNDFLLLKVCIANKLSHDQKIQFLTRFFNKYNMPSIPKSEFFNLIASARGTTFNESSEKIILGGFQDEIWKNINELKFIENDNVLLQSFFQSSTPNCRIINDLISWMFLSQYE